MRGREADWTASGRMREISQPWVTDHLAVLTVPDGPDDGSTLNLKPVDQGPLSIGLLEFGRTYHVFIHDYLPNFEMDQQNPRNRKDFEEVVLAALEGRVRIAESRTPVGYRPRTLLWDSSQWGFAYELGPSMIGFGKRTIEFPPYRSDQSG